MTIDYHCWLISILDQQIQYLGVSSLNIYWLFRYCWISSCAGKSSFWAGRWWGNFFSGFCLAEFLASAWIAIVIILHKLTFMTSILDHNKLLNLGWNNNTLRSGTVKNFEENKLYLTIRLRARDFYQWGDSWWGRSPNQRSLHRNRER